MEQSFKDFLVEKGYPHLASFSRQWIHPELDSYIDSIIDICNPMLEAYHADVPHVEDISIDQYNAICWFMENCTYANGQAKSLPLLNPLLCDLFTAYIQTKDLLVNSREHEGYQIPEFVTKTRDKELFDQLFEFAKYALFPLFGLMWCKYPDRVETIQFAQYSRRKLATTWHNDTYSDMTAVVNLAPELYTGGGTDIRTGVCSFERISSIPKGHVLIFSGSMTLHRGAPVESGIRNLLVFWTTADKTEIMEEEGIEFPTEPITKLK